MEARRNVKISLDMRSQITPQYAPLSVATASVKQSTIGDDAILDLTSLSDWADARRSARSSPHGQVPEALGL